MPLYKIKDVGYDNFPLSDKSHLRAIWNKIIVHCNEFITINNGLNPTIYMSIETFDIINQSLSFSYSNINNSINPVGRFMNWSIYLSDKLYDDEYFLGANEQEIEICKRKNKLNKICGLITEEKQK